MKKRGLVTRIIALVLCAIMFLSVFVGVVFRAFAAEPAETAAVATGSSNSWIIFVAVAVLAVAVAVVCIITGKKKKK